MLTNITIVTYNRLPLTKLCLESLFKKTRGDFVVSVVDNSSNDGTQEFLHSLGDQGGRLRIQMLQRNMGVAVAANLGWASVDADYYVKLDNDVTVIHEDWLTALVETARRNDHIGLVSHLLAKWECTFEKTVLPDGQRFIYATLCNGGCMLIPRNVHEKLGYWIEDYGIYGFTDKDYSERAMQYGYRIGYVDRGMEMVRHNGYAEEYVDPELESLKQSQLEKKEESEQLYVLNRFLFREGIRSLYVPRRYLPEILPDKIRFRTNPEYLPLLKLHREMVGKMDYEVTEESICLDISALKNLG